ncbi:hypothetical protein ACFPPA_07505 [Rhodanobacter ginsengisoli]|uniref:Uncharacterized protein n=1 Tax=Rhodanobacter ginsengisoli TaxID=418646 RepID=A0ABW0QPR7_9GAMM
MAAGVNRLRLQRSRDPEHRRTVAGGWFVAPPHAMYDVISRINALVHYEATID